MISTPSLWCFYVEHTNDDELEISKYLHEDTLVGVDLCDTFLYPLCAHDIFHNGIKCMPNFEYDTIGKSRSGRDLSPWLQIPFYPGANLGWERIILGLGSFCFDVYMSHFLCNICTSLSMLNTKDPWIYFKFVPPRHGILMRLFLLTLTLVS